MMDAKKKSPMAIAILAKLKEKKGSSDDGDSEDELDGGDDEDTEGNIDSEAKTAAAESFFEAGKRGDFASAAGHLEDFLEACGYSK